jgi:hypothetical protein
LLADMNGETPEQKWNRLQREYQKGVQATYPNLERRGCPMTEVLRNLASRSALFEDIEDDEQWKHVIHCAPCYQQYLDLREACRLGEKGIVHRESW